MQGAPATPARSFAQRMDALRRANEVRTYRAKLKRRLAAREESPRDVLAYPEEQVDTMKVFDLLLAMPKVGRVKANRMLVQARISPSKTVGGLSDRQRRELLGRLPR